MKKIITSAVFLIAFGSYGLYRAFGNSTDLIYTAPQTVSIGQSVDNNTSVSEPIPVSSPITSTLSVQTTKPTPTPVTTNIPTQVKQPTNQPLPSPVSVPTPTPVVTPKSKGQYTDGAYTGSVASAYYGNVQVKVTISGGKITDVAFLQYPNDRSTSRYINGQAMPALKNEAIQSQNAQVDTVSGASETSGAFRQSLAAALSQAQG